MAMLDDAMVSVDVSPQDVTIDLIKEAIARQAWGWYDVHKDDVILSRKILFFAVNIHVRDLHGLFVRLFGPEK